MINMASDNEIFWSFRDESFYNFLKHKYSDRQKLSQEAEDKRKALDKMKDGDPLYHRCAVSAEMASLRVDMAYIVDRNNKLEEMIETISFLHQRVDILEGAYSHTKMMAETCRIDYGLISKLHEKLKPLLEEQKNGQGVQTGSTGALHSSKP